MVSKTISNLQLPALSIAFRPGICSGDIPRYFARNSLVPSSSIVLCGRRAWANQRNMSPGRLAALLCVLLVFVILKKPLRVSCAPEDAARLSLLESIWCLLYRWLWREDVLTDILYLQSVSMRNFSAWSSNSASFPGLDLLFKVNVRKLHWFENT